MVAEYFSTHKRLKNNVQVCIQDFIQGEGQHIFPSGGGGGQHQLGPGNPPKSIDFTGPGVRGPPLIRTLHVDSRE